MAQDSHTAIQQTSPLPDDLCPDCGEPEIIQEDNFASCDNCEARYEDRSVHCPKCDFAASPRGDDGFSMIAARVDAELHWMDAHEGQIPDDAPFGDCQCPACFDINGLNGTVSCSECGFIPDEHRLVADGGTETHRVPPEDDPFACSICGEPLGEVNRAEGNEHCDSCRREYGGEHR